MRVTTALVFLAVVCLSLRVDVSAAPFDDANVDVDFFVMAKCPDATFCEPHFLGGIQAVSSIINLNLVYIANETSPGEFSCLHGPTECEGDMQQLCVRQFSNDNPEVEGDRALRGAEPAWFDFALCQSANKSAIPTNGESCATSLGYDWSVIDSCVTDGEGAKLLSESISQIVTENDEISCTINLNSEPWCQHNGGWVACTEGTTNEAFIAAVCARYEGPNTEVCDKLGYWTPAA